MKSSAAIVSEKGQVTIPKPLRERLGLKSGQVIEFKAENGKLIGFKKSQNKGSLDEVVGFLKKKVHVDRYLNDIRGKS